MILRQIHNLDISEVWTLLRSRSEGLQPDEVAQRLAEIGTNTLGPPPRWGWLRTLLQQFANLFSVLLDLSAALCFVAARLNPGEGMAVLGWALLAVAVLNGLFTFSQAIRAERAMQALRNLLPRRITVRRGGVEEEVSIEELVPGDVLLLSEGDRVPADARLVESHDLLANNAPLTGESRHASLAASPVEKGRMVDATNLVFTGCSLLRGSGTAVVYATGRRTEFGRIATLSVQVRRPPTPLEREVSRMVRILTILAVVMGAAFFAYGLAIGRGISDQRGLHGGHHRGQRARRSPAHPDPGAGHGRPAPGQEEGAGEEPERGRGAGLRRGDLHRQDRNLDQEPAGRDRRGRRVHWRASRRSSPAHPAGDRRGRVRDPSAGRRAHRRSARRRCCRSAAKDWRRSDGPVTRSGSPHRLRRAAEACGRCARRQRVPTLCDQGSLGGRPPARARLPRGARRG